MDVWLGSLDQKWQHGTCYLLSLAVVAELYDASFVVGAVVRDGSVASLAVGYAGDSVD